MAILHPALAATANPNLPGRQQLSSHAPSLCWEASLVFQSCPVKSTGCPKSMHSGQRLHVSFRQKQRDANELRFWSQKETGSPRSMLQKETRLKSFCPLKQPSRMPSTGQQVRLVTVQHYAAIYSGGLGILCRNKLCAGSPRLLTAPFCGWSPVPVDPDSVAFCDCLTSAALWGSNLSAAAPVLPMCCDSCLDPSQA